FFCCCAYAELLDKTYYLNHYYLVTLFAFLLIWAPAHRRWSLDVLLRPSLHTLTVPAWAVLVFRWQLCLIYFCAGLSKLTADWLLHAEPLRIWLPAKASVPLLGPLLRQEWAAWLFSWAGAAFDLSIPFILLHRKTRLTGYILVVVFHTLTAVLFQIGMFPYLMMSATLVFFFDRPVKEWTPWQPRRENALLLVVGLYFLWQVLMPFRFLLYPGNLLWTEEGYRFSWRVMLMEKGGAAFFYVKDPATGKRFEVNNSAFLTAYQERMMETQPDMMLQYAHILEQYYKQQGLTHPEVTVESYITLNGSGSRLYIDSTINLAAQQESWFGHKSWILPFKK
ncbi:MAG: HTTM domain-containing protein, partial [Chitinophaga rupis]